MENRNTETEKTLKGALEAILFAMGDAMPLSQLARAVDKTPEETKEALLAMKEEYSASDRGIRLLELEDSYQLSTKSEYSPELITIVKNHAKPVLTDVLMETLSIIAYKQPVTRAEIEKIRGVSASHAINKLMEYDLIRELGRLNVPGRPILLGTTERFLRSFGIESVANLPQVSAVQLEDFKAEAEAELNIQVEV